MRPSDSPYIRKTRELGRDRTSEFGAKAFELCHGRGLEIGAVNCPFDVDADVSYLDQVDSRELLRRHSGDPNVEDVIPVTFISRSLNYDFFADGVFDFVIASHVLEHLPNPCAAVEEFVRIVRPGGIVYLIVPHKDHCFDKDRDVTPMSRLIGKYFDNVTSIERSEYRDIAFHGFDPAGLDGAVARGILADCEDRYAQQLDFHIHTFTHGSFWGLLEWLAPRIGASVVHRQWNELHIHAALRKT